MRSAPQPQDHRSMAGGPKKGWIRGTVPGRRPGRSCRTISYSRSLLTQRYVEGLPRRGARGLLGVPWQERQGLQLHQASTSTKTSDPYTVSLPRTTRAKGRLTWAAAAGIAPRHMFTVLRCNKEGKLLPYREYFNPQYHWPETTVDAGDGDTFDYNKERKRVGLEPVR